MSTKNRKIKKQAEEIVEQTTEEISAKELYDMKKEEKLKAKEKTTKKEKKSSKNKKNKKTYSANLGAKIFAIFMLLLMVASVISSVVIYFQ